MTPSTRYAALTAQRAYARRVAAFGLPALLAPYRGAVVRPVPEIPAQRRRVLRSEAKA